MSSSKATVLKFCGTVGLACAGVIAGVGWYRGGIDPTLWVGAKSAPVNVDFEPPTVPEKVEPVLDPELLDAQSEPDADDDSPSAENADSKARHRRKTHRTGDLLDESDLDDAAGTVQTANFEESDDSEPAASSPRTSLGSTRDGIAASEQTRAAKASRSTAEPDAADARNAPLLSLEAIDAIENDGDLIQAQRELSRRYWQKPAEREEILPRLNRMARALYFSPQPHYYEPYVVQQGDQLRVIGQKHKLAWEYLSRLNHVDSRKIRAGQKLKVVPGPFGASVSLSRYELVIHLNGSYVKSYRVGVGKDGSSPIGTFAVKNKMIDPTYYGPEGVIAHDDPQNPLGERWIDIGDSYGIHGTIEPQSIGKSESRGCIRMLNSDVEEVYDFLVNGSEVRIQR